MINFITLNLLNVDSYKTSTDLTYYPMCKLYIRNTVHCIDSSYNEVTEVWLKMNKKTKDLRNLIKFNETFVYLGRPPQLIEYWRPLLLRRIIGLNRYAIHWREKVSFSFSRSFQLVFFIETQRRITNLIVRYRVPDWFWEWGGLKISQKV
jgi:hypothetical protein